MSVQGQIGTAANASNGHPQAKVLRVQPTFHPSDAPESSVVQSTLKTLDLDKHIEGGYFVLTDLSTQSIPSPYPPQALSPRTMAITAAFHDGTISPTRLLSTTIYYYLTPHRPMGSFHKNRSKIIHTLHKGRGQYVLVRESGEVETFVVGKDIEKGEKLSWVVEGDVYKASFLLEDAPGKGSEGLLISETVVPGFDYADHEFLEEQRLRKLVSGAQADALKWLVKGH